MDECIFKNKKEAIIRLTKEAAFAFVPADIEMLEKILGEINQIKFETEIEVNQIKPYVEVLEIAINFFLDAVRNNNSNRLGA